MNSEPNIDLDQLIDGALKGYAAAEPRPGLEQRVLNRIPTERRWSNWWWALPAPLAAAIAFWMMLPPAPESITIAHQRIAPPVPVAVRTEVPKPKARIRHKLVLPKQEQFPLPAPTTREEKALVAFAALHADRFIDWRKRMDEPIEIKEIQIQPLQTDDGSR